MVFYETVWDTSVKDRPAFASPIEEKEKQKQLEACDCAGCWLFGG
jgi:hypothetical protein